MILPVSGHGPTWKEDGHGILVEDDGLDGYASLADPVAWLEDDDTGLYYRRATDNEVQSNGWFHSTYLVEVEEGIDGARGGASPWTMLVPIEDTATEAFSMNLTTSENQVSIEIVVGGSTRTQNISMHTYEGFQNASRKAARFKSSDAGGMYGRAIFNRTDDVNVTGEAFGHLSWWVIDDLLTVDGTTVNESAVVAILLSELETDYGLECAMLLSSDNDGGCGSGNEDPNPETQCSNGADDDDDEWTDYPDDPGCISEGDNDEADLPSDRTFIVMGEMKWCTVAGNDWDEAQDGIRDSIRAGFRGQRDTRVRLAETGWNVCWSHPNGINAARACDWGQSDPTDCWDQAAHAYTFFDARNRSEIYRDEAWDYLAHAKLHGDIPPTHVVQITHDGGMDGDTLCGIASFPDIWSGWDEDNSGPKPTGDSVAGRGISRANTGECPSLTPTHEVGHNFFAFHDHSNTPAWASGCQTVMGTGNGCRVNAFSDSNRKHIEECVDGNPTACPRVGTG